MMRTAREAWGMTMPLGAVLDVLSHSSFNGATT
jgi:hypothetical protein